MSELDISITNNLNPKKGRLLLSEPFLKDDYFSRAVILICEHTPEGSFGFVLNNYSDMSFMDINPAFPDIPLRVSLGGPVKEEHLYFIHKLNPETIGGQHIVGDLYLGGDFEMVLQLIQANPEIQKYLRFFLGYSGWGSGQLNDELKENSWLLIDSIDEEYLMDTEIDEIWKDIMKNQGGKYRVISQFPLDPRMN
jgi:putative transcriptional regulator